ncbi:MAG: SPOR domain-containing protein [Arsenophonus sp.]
MFFIFISNLYFFIQNKGFPIFNKKTLRNTYEAINSLPPKPEERWRYIKELEKKGTDLENFHYSIKSNINNKNKLINDQSQPIKQINIDKSNYITNLSKLDNNNDSILHSREVINTTQTKSSLQLKSFSQPKQPMNKNQKIMVQCGLFKNLGKAELIKANLAFLGLESTIISTKGWYRVVLGPYNKKIAEKIRDQAKSFEILRCILHTDKG